MTETDEIEARARFERTQRMKDGEQDERHCRREDTEDPEGNEGGEHGLQRPCVDEKAGEELND